MSNLSSNKGKHLTLVDRMYIEDALSHGYTLKEIAAKLGKDPTTISKEIKRNRIVSSRKGQREFITCNNKKACNRKNICSSECNRLCKKCPTINCYRTCPDYTTKQCSILSRYPYVCNGCSRTIVCHIEKYHYRAKVADANYRELLKSSREGLDITPGELNQLDSLISPLILKGQSISHVYENHKTEISCSERTLYKYFDYNVFTARNIDLPRKVKYKSRKKASFPKEVPTHRLGRTYDEFSAFLEANPDIPVVEMDTIHGNRGGKSILTFFFRSCSLMIAFLLEACTQECVKEAIDDIYERLGADVFKRTFSVILTDNGSEFKAPELLEYDDCGKQRTKLFYCNPMASYQKPHIEKNHEYIRYILPKGKSFDKLTQEQVTLMMNHINSTARASRNGCSPFQLAQMLLDNVLIEELSLKLISADEVHLKPALLKK